MIIYDFTALCMKVAANPTPNDFVEVNKENE